MPQSRRPARQPGRPSARAPARGRTAPARRRSDLGGRVLIAIPAVIVAIGFVDLGGVGWALFMAAMGCACVSELYRMLARWKPVSAIGLAAVIAMCLAARFGNLRDVLTIALAAVPLLFLAVAARGQQGGATISIAGTLLGVYWIALAFSAAVLLRQLPHGKGIVIDVMVGTFLGDTGAYFGGRVFGRRPLAPEISPNKTVEGLFMGMLVAIVAVYFASLYQQPWLSGGRALILGLAIAVLGPIGDLFESLVKRDAGAKDAGTMFGAHGGALDRLDAAMFTIVGAYFIWAAIPHP